MKICTHPSDFSFLGLVLLPQQHVIKGDTMSYTVSPPRAGSGLSNLCNSGYQKLRDCVLLNVMSGVSYPVQNDPPRGRILTALKPWL